MLARMGRTIRDLEAYLAASGRAYTTVDEGTLVLAPSGDGKPPIGLRVAGPVVFSVEIGKLPSPPPVPLLQKLLELNATDLLYCAYGLRDGAIVLASAHELENLDRNELEAILSDFDIAIARHLPELFALAGTPGKKD